MNWKETVWRNRKGASTLEYVVVITAAIILAMALYHTLTGGDVKASIQERVAAAFQLKGGAPPDSPQAQPSDQPANQTSDQKKPAEAPPAAPKPEEKSTGEKIVNGVLDFVGYHDAKAAITGVDENGNKVGVGERIFRGALALPIAKPVKGVKMATKYGDDVLAAGKKKFDDFAQRSKKVACNCPGGSGKLKSIGNGKWKSSAGLIYGQGSKHGNRVKHVLAHARPDPTKPKHSVFVGGRKKVLGLVDEAWSMRSKVKPVIQKNGNAVYNVPMGKQVGTQGEKTVRIVVRQGTSEVITAFPVP